MASTAPMHASVAATVSTAVSSPSSSAAAAAATLWATCAVMFGGAFLTGLPALLFWKGGAGRPAQKSGGLGSLLQGRGMRMLSAGLMLGSGLGVVVPEGFFAFMEGDPGEEAAGLPEWCAGAALVTGFVGMLVLQLWLERAGGRAADGAGHGASCGHHQHQQHRHHHHGHRTRQAPVSGPGYYQRLPTSEAAAAAGPFDVESAAAASAAAPTAAVAGPSVRMAGISRRIERTTPVAAGADGGGSRRGGDGTAATATAYVSLTATAGSADGDNNDDEPTAARRRRGRREEVNGTEVTTASSARGSSSDESFATVDSGSGGDTATAAAAVTARTLGGGAGDGAGGTVVAAASASPAQLALGGLLVHSAADGLAVGAASLGGGTSGGSLGLSLTVAAAIMAHKLPVTFGLTSYLREAGWSPGRVVRGLLAFSASAPVAALATFYLLQLVLRLLPGADGSSSSSSNQAVALAVLFSGGTFLAAATQHILPAALEVPPEEGGLYGEPCSNGREGDSGGGEGEGSRGTSGVSAGRGEAGGSSGLLPLLLLAAGAVLPLLIAALIPEVD